MQHLHRSMLATALATGLLACAAAVAQKAPERKIYCWDDGGRKVCGDALPAEAASSARTEISGKSGLATRQVARALSGDEQVLAEQAEAAARQAAEAEAMRQRRDLAMVESYMTEGDLRRAYGERISLLDETLKASRLGIANLRLSLLSQLRQAGDRELAGEVVPKSFRDTIRQQHDDLLRQQRILADQARDRAALDAELADALQRYRALKDPPSAPTATAAGSGTAAQR